MAYKAVFRGNALKEFEGLSQGQKKAIAKKIKAIQADPFARGSVELKKYAPLRRIKAGDARMIYDPEPDTQGQLSMWRFGVDHSIYDDLGDLYEAYLSELMP